MAAKIVERGSFFRRCPKCGYLFTVIVYEDKRTFGGAKARHVFPKLFDSDGVEELHYCPGCDRDSTPFNTVAIFSKNGLGNLPAKVE